MQLTSQTKIILSFLILINSTFATAQIDTSSFPASIGSCESITQVAAQRAGGNYQRGEYLRSLSRQFMNIGMRLNSQNANAGVTYVNSKNTAYQNALNASDAELNSSLSKCVKLTN